MRPMSLEPFEALTVAQLRGRAAMKWQAYPPDVLPLWVAEMDVLPVPEVVEAVTAAVRAGDTGYPRRDTEYPDAFAGFAAARWGWAPEAADTVVCADVMTGIRGLLLTATDPGGRVVIPSPVYPPFTGMTREIGRQPVPVPLLESGRLDLPAIGVALAAGAGAGAGAGARERQAVLLCSPHNPTGVVHTADELRELDRLARATGATVIADEVHAPLVTGPTPFTPWLTVAQGGFSVTSAAKAFNLAGFKAALVIAHPERRAALESLPMSVRYGASHLGVIAHSAALRSDSAWLDAVVANIRGNAALLADLLAERAPGVGYRVPEATYLAWLDVRGLGLGAQPYDTLLEQGRLALTDGSTFGPGGAGHVRLNFACSREVLSEAVLRLASAPQNPRS